MANFGASSFWSAFVLEKSTVKIQTSEDALGAILILCPQLGEKHGTVTRLLYNAV